MLLQNLKLKTDLIKIPDRAHVEKIIPGRLLLFLSFLYEGMAILVVLRENLSKRAILS